MGQDLPWLRYKITFNSYDIGVKCSFIVFGGRGSCKFVSIWLQKRICHINSQEILIIWICIICVRNCILILREIFKLWKSMSRGDHGSDITDGSSEHVTHSGRKIGFFGRNTIGFVTALELIQCMKHNNRACSLRAHLFLSSYLI